MRSRICRSSDARGVVHLGLQQEAVHLRLRQRVGALLLDRVLGGEDQEGVRQRVRDVAQRHLPLLHRLEEGRLHLGGGAVDLVGEQQVREDRPLARHELAGLLLEDEGAHEVGRQQVRGELDAREVEVEHLPERLHRERLGETRHALDQQVAAAEQRHHHPLDERLLADDHLADLVDRRLHQDRLLAHGLVQLRDVDLGSYPCHRVSSLLALSASVLPHSFDVPARRKDSPSSEGARSCSAGRHARAGTPPRLRVAAPPRPGWPSRPAPPGRASSSPCCTCAIFCAMLSRLPTSVAFRVASSTSIEGVSVTYGLYWLHRFRSTGAS